MKKALCYSLEVTKKNFSTRFIQCSIYFLMVCFKAINQSSTLFKYKIVLITFEKKLNWDWVKEVKKKMDISYETIKKNKTLSDFFDDSDYEEDYIVD